MTDQTTTDTAELDPDVRLHAILDRIAARIGDPGAFDHVKEGRPRSRGHQTVTRKTAADSPPAGAYVPTDGTTLDDLPPRTGQRTAHAALARLLTAWGSRDEGERFRGLVLCGPHDAGKTTLLRAACSSDPDLSWADDLGDDPEGDAVVLETLLKDRTPLLAATRLRPGPLADALGPELHARIEKAADVVYVLPPHHPNARKLDHANR